MYAFLQVWLSRDKFISESHINAFAYKVIGNQCANYLKREKIKQKAYFNYSCSMLYTEVNVETKFIETEFYNCIETAVHQLPHKYGKAFRMSYLDGLSIDAIAKRLNIAKKTAYSMKAQAIEKLKESLILNGINQY